VIGNSAYGGGADLLSIPINDAQLIDTTCVNMVFPYPKSQMQQADYETVNRIFSKGIASEDEVVFYYSGHGVQVNGINYLMPLNHNITRRPTVSMRP
jgi:uncharacterized caspase-like protein